MNFFDTNFDFFSSCQSFYDNTTQVEVNEGVHCALMDAELSSDEKDNLEHFTFPNITRTPYNEIIGRSWWLDDNLDHTQFLQEVKNFLSHNTDNSDSVIASVASTINRLTEKLYEPHKDHYDILFIVRMHPFSNPYYLWHCDESFLPLSNECIKPTINALAPLIGKGTHYLLNKDHPNTIDENRCNNARKQSYADLSDTHHVFTTPQGAISFHVVDHTLGTPHSFPITDGPRLLILALYQHKNALGYAEKFAKQNLFSLYDKKSPPPTFA